MKIMVTVSVLEQEAQHWALGIEIIVAFVDQGRDCFLEVFGEELLQLGLAGVVGWRSVVLLVSLECSTWIRELGNGVWVELVVEARNKEKEPCHDDVYPWISSLKMISESVVEFVDWSQVLCNSELDECLLEYFFWLSCSSWSHSEMTILKIFSQGELIQMPREETPLLIESPLSS